MDSRIYFRNLHDCEIGHNMPSIYATTSNLRYDENMRYGEERSVVVSTSACHATGQRSGFDFRTRRIIRLKTWLSTLEIVYLCVFRMRH